MAGCVGVHLPFQLLWEAQNRRIIVYTGLGKDETLLKKNQRDNKEGRAGGVAQAVEHLPSKLEALSSNPVSPQNKIIK
jgi:hypothetical protein